MTYDLDGSAKLVQMDLLGQMFHASPFGKIIVREDATIAWANKNVSQKLNIHEVTFQRLTIHDLVIPEVPGVVYSEKLQGHMEHFTEWFQHPYDLTLESRKHGEPFQIWGFDVASEVRVSHDCIVVIKPLVARKVGEMIAVEKKDEEKELLAFASIVFLDDFRNFYAQDPDIYPNG